MSEKSMNILEKIRAFDRVVEMLPPKSSLAADYDEAKTRLLGAMNGTDHFDYAMGNIHRIIGEIDAHIALSSLETSETPRHYV